MTERAVRTSEPTLESLYATLPEYHYEPLWTMRGALTRAPTTTMEPYLWHYEDVRAFLLSAGGLISAKDADRRVLAMKNPGAADHEVARTTDTLWAAVQLVLPGEVAPAHRHTPAALRYIIEGDGGYTVVDGSRVDMHRGDFLVTPNWTWHEHGHTGEEPMLWLDGLDLPIVKSLRGVFAEFDGEGAPPARPVGAAVRSGALRPMWMSEEDAATLVWSFEDVQETLEHSRADAGSEFDDLIVEYQDPRTRGSVMPTMAAAMQLLRGGVETRAHRHTNSAVYHVVSGTGWTEIDGQRLNWREGDTFALPVWAEHRHASPHCDSLLFSFTDRPALERLGLLRETAS